MSKKSVVQQMSDAVPGLRLVEAVVYLPAGHRKIPVELIQEWDPRVAAISYKDDSGLVHSLHGCPVELVFEESRITRL
jgi:hypothetical protein